MNKNKNILQRAKDFDLTEAELDALYSNPNQLSQLHGEALIDKITEDLFIPGTTALIEERKEKIENQTKHSPLVDRKPFAFSMRFMGIAASLVILIGAFFLLQPQDPELSEIQIAEFKEISRSTYSPEVIASLERSIEINHNQELVTAFINKDYEFILSATEGEPKSAELQLLRARVLMDLERYEEGFEIMKAIDQVALIQQDVYLWMMAEGALGVGDEEFFYHSKELIIKERIPKFEKIKY